MSVTDSYNKLLNETPIEVVVAGVNSVYLKMASGKYYNVETVPCVLSFHGMEVKEITEDNYNEMKEEAERFNQLNLPRLQELLKCDVEIPELI